MQYETLERNLLSLEQPYFRQTKFNPFYLVVLCFTILNIYDRFMLLDGNNGFDLSKNRPCHDFEFFEKQQVAFSCRRV